ncbi:MAG: GNAT family N-acetyltransferase, partial [Bryobacteraceae bacterium]
CGALHFYTPAMGEVRSLAVLPDIKQQGIGRAIVDALETEALENNLEAMFAFTYVPQFFAKLGFNEVERGELPLKVWKDCLRCPKFQNCDEIAVMKRLRPGTANSHEAEHVGVTEESIHLPRLAS